MSNLSALDMALDDVISKNRNNKRNNTRRNTRGGINKNRSSGGRSSPYNGARSSRNTAVSRKVNNTSRNSNSLVVANLHFNVTEKDLYDLFGQIGPVKRAFLHIGPNGKSAGIADVVFQSSQDAERAKNTYNNVELDGRPMRISNASLISAVSSMNTKNDKRSNNNKPRGGSGNNFRRRRRENRPKLSQEDLDADMDSYMGNANEDTQMN
ncbi:uncharacterized protein BX663DRAFT_497791 [Cokeromyces recurvatus]|uniref:uncharacterized protein n=1 Tax=Cokeromyces recurvatus TaxID=90255 RepID=UPI00221E3E48|nr:uncharacterized protein BX663DRAFT_497791 [Cokeromyces recurvatus]KAI7905833.1 hypothetical protein BX663DRAFT_497791 [Cokeromyces recurvatus]